MSEADRFGSTKGQQRAGRRYSGATSTKDFGDERFRFRLLRGDKPPLNIDRLVTGAGWSDEEAVLRGALSLTRPRELERLPIRAGHMVVCEVQRRTGGPWRELWRMRVVRPTAQVDQGTLELDLESDLARAARSTGDFKFRKGKNRHKRGWLCHQIAQEVCEDQRIRVNRLVRGKHRIAKLTELDASPVEVIRQAYSLEAKHSGRRYIIEYRRKGLTVRPFRYPRHMLILGRTILTAQITKAQRAGFATAITVVGTIGDGKSKRKVEETVVNKRAVKRYGYIHKVSREGNLKSEADARRKARRQLARSRQPIKEVTFTHPGIPGLQRFDALRLRLPEEGFHEVCWVQSVTHTLSAESYEMDVTVRFSDPYRDARQERVRRRKKRAAERRRRAAGEDAPQDDPTPAKGEQRS